MLSFLCTLVLVALGNAIVCSPGYTCFEETPSRVWVIKDDGNINGPSCASVCSAALCPSGTYHSCDAQRPVLEGVSFTAVAAGLGFTCQPGDCFSNSMSQMMWASISTTSPRTCYFPANTSGTYDCNAHPGNANCWGERYSMVCPCAPSALDQSCPAQMPSKTAMAQWSPPNSPGTTCLERINYWRQRACAEGWPECPPCGLPPMTECTSCHECANSQADYDEIHGAHSSFMRCGDSNQGEGGGLTCAAVIDGFVAERQVFPDSNGQVVCRGHCGPILQPGCQSFFWGRSIKGFHTLNWGTCNVQACGAYCNDPTKTQLGGACRTDQWSFNSSFIAPPTPVPTPSVLADSPPATRLPTRTPTRTPSRTPTRVPTRLPSRLPSVRPTIRPTRKNSG